MTIESISEYRERARRGSSRGPRRRTAEAPQAWGDGEFSVVVFHDATDEEELELLGAYRGWHEEKVAAGFGAIAVSTEWGGLGLSPGHDAAFKELETEFEVPRDHEVISVTSKLIAPTIEEFGTPEQRQRWCRTFFQLEELCCQLFSEPGAGSDLAGLACKAVRDGDEWVLDGQKVWTSTARIARVRVRDLPHRPRSTQARWARRPSSSRSTPPGSRSVRSGRCPAAPPSTRCSSAASA